MKKYLNLITVLGLCSAIAFFHAVNTSAAANVGKQSPTAPQCPPIGSWIDPAAGDIINPTRVIESLGQESVVLLGENHLSEEDHRWQLHTIAALYARNPEMVIGFEMFPRDVQSVLNQWVSGDIEEQAFIEAVNWEENWGYDIDLYLPLFHFARQNRVPMLAINVRRELVARVADIGWENIPVNEREGLTDPTPPDADYVRELAYVFAMKQALSHDGSDFKAGARESDKDKIEQILANADFQKFAQAQSTWDRAMAEGLASGREAHQASIAVGIMGVGHVAHGHGVAHQLDSLGVTKIATSLTTSSVGGCTALRPGLADIVFITPESTPKMPEYPVLGVQISATSNGVRIVSVEPESVGNAAGLEAGDIVTSAAGVRLDDSPTQLIRVVRRQAPGTWLPMEIRRGGTPLSIVARFPTSQRSPD